MKEINNSKKTVSLPILVALTLAAGIFIGAKFFGSTKNAQDVIKSSAKFKEILTYIDKSYVDEVDTDSLADYGIAKMLEKLDPHTSYLPADQAKLAMESLQNGFDGIGVEFNIFNDTLFVVSPLSGGPSEKVGIQSGDAILKANETVLTGKDLDNGLVFKTLRGPRGTEVKMKIKRKGLKETLEYTVLRDKIPTYSVDAAYLMDDKQTGYIKVSRFSASTFQEFKNHLANLKGQGMKRLMLDLRGNPGGYLDRATDMVDELVGGNGIIVYTDGKDDRNDQQILAGNKGIFEKEPIVVLVDEGSASASEIVSGSLQDYDRAIIVGRRTFGKGLVQAPIGLDDGSELRMTISRYYIPSGRSIQKPYELGKQDEYREELYERAEHGELLVQDSIQVDKKQEYKTVGGRTVYGGGGITPDIFVPRDTTYFSTYLFKLFSTNVLRSYGVNYAQKHGETLRKKGLESFVKSFTISPAIIAEVKELGTKSGVDYNEKEYKQSESYLKSILKAHIARSVWKQEESTGLSNAFYEVLNQTDDMVNAGMLGFSRADKLK